MSNGRSTDDHRASRATAARLLRAARRSTAEAHAQTVPSADAVDWILLAAPASIPARRLKIEQLRLVGDGDHADVLIAQSLLIRPTHSGLLLLKARRLCDLGQWIEADGVVRTVLEARPWHGATHALAGQIALRLGRAAEAVGHFEAALSRASATERGSVACRLVQALLALQEDAAALEQAGTVAADLADDAARSMWLARVRRAQGRLFDAVELLEWAVQHEAQPETRRDLLVELIDVLEEAGDVPRLEHWLGEPEALDPVVLLRAALIWLACGSFEQVLERLAPLTEEPRLRRQALPMLMAAAAMTHRAVPAERWMEQWRSESGFEGDDQPAMAQAWMRAIQGRLLVEQRCARSAGADPMFSQLQPLLRRAVGTFDEELALIVDHDSSGSAHVDLRRHRAVCLAALDRAA